MQHAFLLGMTLGSCSEVYRLTKKYNLPTTLLSWYPHIMVYTSPSKVSHVVELCSLSFSHENIGARTSIHHTTVARILKRFEKNPNPYFVRPKSGCPRKLDEWDVRVGARMLVKMEVSNATELAKTAFSDVSCQTVARALKEHGLICHVCRSRPYISPANKKKWLLWALQHKDWTVDDWKKVIFSDKSKFRWPSICLV